MWPIPTEWIIKGVIAAALIAALWILSDKIVGWHEDSLKLPTVQAQLQKELDCEAGSECDKKAQARVAKAEQDAALRASTAIATAVAGEEATRKEAAAWRARFKEAQISSPACAAWAIEAVGCPL